MSAASVLLDSPALETLRSLRTVPGAGSSANKSQQLHTQVRDAFLGIGNLSTMQEGDDGKNLESMTAKLAQVHTLVARKVAKEPRRWVSSKWKGDVATQAAELHPILLTLLLAVVDIYTHRSHQNSYFERARAMIRAKCTTGIAGIALEFRTAFQKSMESASRNLMRRVDTDFLKQHAQEWERIRAAMKRAHGRPARKNATLDQFLEDAAAAAEAEKGNGMRMYGHAAAASATKAKAKANVVTYPSSLMGGIVETLPWKRLQQRLALWKMQLQQCRRVLQLQSGVGSDGVALSRALAEGQRKCLAVAAALPEEPIDANDANASQVFLADWSRLASDALPEELAQEQDSAQEEDSPHSARSDAHGDAYKALQDIGNDERENENGLSLVAELSAKLHEQRTQAREALDRLRQRLALRVQKTFAAEASALQAAEMEALSTLSASQHTFLRGSLSGERALSRELKQACSGSEFSWRNVQRLMLIVVGCSQDGSQAAAMRTFSEEVLELKNFVARAKVIVERRIDRPNRPKK